MPKDWKRHKAELERLYIVEKRPLEEVRQILRDRYGFVASTRAYRMRLDEWGLRKYSTGKDEQPVKALPRSRPLAPEQELGVVARKEGSEIENDSSSEDEGIQFPGGIRIPKRPIKVADLLRFIPQYSKHTFEILLVKWQKDGQYLETMSALLKEYEYRHFIWTRTAAEFPAGEWLLNLVQRKASDEEQIVLIKLLLRFGLMWPFSLGVDAWVEVSNWSSAFHTNYWDEAKECLNRHGAFSEVFGQRALKCALVVLAEKHLRAKRDRLQCVDSAVKNLKACHEYLDILGDFESAEIDVDRSWYKYGLQIRKECEIAAHDQLRAGSRPAEDIQIYRQLIASYTGIPQEQLEQVDELMKAEAVTRSLSKKVPNDILGDEIRNHSRLPNNSIEHSTTLSIPNAHSIGAADSTNSIARSTLKKLLAQYLSGVKLDGEAIQSTFSAMGYVPRFYHWNVFDLIPEEVERRDRILFATTLMTACFRDKLEHSFWPLFLGASFSYQTLERFYNIKSWEQFQREIKVLEICISGFEIEWSSDVIKLFSDCMTLVVGERLLINLETEKKLGACLGRALSVHDKYFREYVSILRTFADRGLEVDGSWLFLLFDMIESDAAKRRGKVDDASEMEY